jgi:hypothetical protein
MCCFKTVITYALAQTACSIRFFTWVMYCEAGLSFETFVVLQGREISFVLLPPALPVGRGMPFVELRSCLPGLVLYK